MRFTVPDGYSVIILGQLVQSVGGVIETDDAALIEQLSKNPHATPEQQAEQSRNLDTKPEVRRGRPAKATAAD